MWATTMINRNITGLEQTTAIYLADQIPALDSADGQTHKTNVWLSWKLSNNTIGRHR